MPITKVITIKSAKVTEKDGKSWVELTDHEDKVHRVFPSIQKEDGSWCHFEKEIELLVTKINGGTIEGSTFQLTKEKKGKFWNVVAIEEVKDIMQKEAVKRTADVSELYRYRSIVLAYAKDLCVASKIEIDHVISWADYFTAWVMHGAERPAPKNTTHKETAPAEIPQANTQTEAEPTVSKDKVFAIIAEKLGWRSTQPVQSFLVNRIKIPQEVIDGNPELCLELTRKEMKWTENETPTQ